MKKIWTVLTASVVLFLLPAGASAQKDQRYIDVVGVSEIEIVPDEIHFIIAIKEYYEEEFDGRSKPEDYRTKVPIDQIERSLRKALNDAGIAEGQIRVEEVGDYWRERGRRFLIGKNFDITLSDFRKIDDILSAVDTKGITSMRIGELKNREMQRYHREGKIAALRAAREKAEYLLAALGEKPGQVISVIEHRAGTDDYMTVRSNMKMADGAYAEETSSASASDAFRLIRLKYTMNVRFEIE